MSAAISPDVLELLERIRARQNARGRAPGPLPFTGKTPRERPSGPPSRAREEARRRGNISARDAASTRIVSASRASAQGLLLIDGHTRDMKRSVAWCVNENAGRRAMGAAVMPSS